MYQKHFQDLELNELYDILALRNRVFITEQKSPFNDVDGADRSALHFMIYNYDSVAQEFVIISYGRFNSDEKPPILRIGRIATDAEYRRRGYSRQIMASILDYIHKSFAQDFEIQLQAQEYLYEFYKEFGFQASSDPYLDEGVMHVDMIMDKKTLNTYVQNQINQ